MTKEERLAYFIIETKASETALDFSKIFPLVQPLHIEIGCGRGEFMVAVAQQRPDINFLGLETKERRVESVAKKMDVDTHSNARISRLHVDNNVNKLIKAGSVDVIYIQHPDPWPKRRHYKHRIVQNDFIDVCKLILAPAGQIRISTDHPDYGRWVKTIFDKRNDFDIIYEGFYNEEYMPDHVVTYYEKKWRAAGFEPQFFFYQLKSGGYAWLTKKN